MNLKNTMTSREVPELKVKRHGNVVRDTEAMFNALKIEAVDFLDNYVDNKGQKAELIGKRHDNVIADCDKMLEELGGSNFGPRDFLLDGT